MTFSMCWYLHKLLRRCCCREREREMRALETCLVFSYVPDDSSSTSIRHGSLSVKALLVSTSKATRTAAVVVFFFKFNFFRNLRFLPTSWREREKNAHTRLVANCLSNAHTNNKRVFTLSLPLNAWHLSANVINESILFSPFSLMTQPSTFALVNFKGFCTHTHTRWNGWKSDNNFPSSITRVFVAKGFCVAKRRLATLTSVHPRVESTDATKRKLIGILLSASYKITRRLQDWFDDADNIGNLLLLLLYRFQLVTL